MKLVPWIDDHGDKQISRSILPVPYSRDFIVLPLFAPGKMKFIYDISAKSIRINKVYYPEYVGQIVRDANLHDT